MNKNDEINNLKMNYHFSEELKRNLDLKSHPVAIKFILHKKDIPKNIKKINQKIRHCEMVQNASQGDEFYSTCNEQLCKGGSAALGLEKPPKNVTTGEFYHDLGRFKSVGSAKRTMDEIPKMDLNSYAILYSPLEKADFTPDIIVIIANPKQIMLSSQAIVYNLGGKLESSFAGIQSVCADAVAGPFINKTPNVTLGCNGSRKFGKIKDEELVMGLNGENIDSIITALNSMES
ncbi:hypothetical protein MBCUT_01890 [Methanobrevibacter cuticularis]|uniref:DUF169 domain-containing protein n=1 Tax=Methanobrevibacter cuticularis TaxID=47311 RepID=A0A166FBZ0_9EURY|nr:DUF169 domain-containing protein [Methanobrevibacter cuticularis]KZX17514.1 hypothetical protein MBCUT_01890 [Methanobrevibacter cuticularis]